MFGKIKIPAIFEHPLLYFKTSYHQNTIIYKRELSGEIIEKKIASKRKRNLFINLVEPINTPDSITTHLFIELENPIIIEPQSSYSIFLTCPVEVGDFIKNDKKRHLINVFSLSQQKFTLYGEPTGGVICKYWHSVVHHSIPKVIPFSEGVINLTIKNKTNNWTEINKVIFSSYHMKIFYNDEIVFMRGNMKITDKGIAETNFEKVQSMGNMKRSLEIYNFSKLYITSTVYVMEYGL